MKKKKHLHTSYFSCKVFLKLSQNLVPEKQYRAFTIFLKLVDPVTGESVGKFTSTFITFSLGEPKRSPGVEEIVFQGCERTF